MSNPDFGQQHLLLSIYTVAFGLAGVVCFVSMLRAKRIVDRDTRIGLLSVLLLSGTWSLTYVG